MASPTQNAEHFFRVAYQRSLVSAGRIPVADRDPASLALYDLAATLAGVTQGCSQLAIALRQTYAMLERLERKLDNRR